MTANNKAIRRYYLSIRDKKVHRGDCRYADINDTVVPVATCVHPETAKASAIDRGYQDATLCQCCDNVSRKD